MDAPLSTTTTCSAVTETSVCNQRQKYTVAADPAIKPTITMMMINRSSSLDICIPEVNRQPMLDGSGDRTSSPAYTASLGDRPDAANTVANKNFIGVGQHTGLHKTFLNVQTQFRRHRLNDQISQNTGYPTVMQLGSKEITALQYK